MLEVRIRNTPVITFDDTIATGKIKYNLKNIIKLSSNNIYDEIIQSVTCREYYDKTLKDKIKIKFNNVNYHNHKLNFTPRYEIQLSAIYQYDWKFFSLMTDSICIPSSTSGIRDMGLLSSIQFSISCDNEASGFSSIDMGMQLSPTCLRFGGIEGFKFKNPNNNVIEISISALSMETAFSRFYIKSEYCKVSPNSITWRDKVFRKISDEIIDLETLKKRYD